MAYFLFGQKLIVPCPINHEYWNSSRMLVQRLRLMSMD